MKQIFGGVFFENRKLFTKNLVPGKRVYGEQLVKLGKTEYREWIPRRSKLAAAIMNGLKKLPLNGGSRVLYLGASEGTTASHVSDIVGEQGAVFGVEIAETPMRKFLEICGDRKNIVPVLADAEKPMAYRQYIEGIEIDLLYQDISQRNQAEIFNRNAEMFLRKGKLGLLAIKAKSISQEKKAKDVFDEETGKLKQEFEVIQAVNLSPFEKDHLMVLCRKK